MADGIARRLHMSNEWRNEIVWLVDQHMRVADIPEMREARRKRFVREPAFSELLTLCRMDCLASHADTSIVEWIQTYINALPRDAIRPPRLLTGVDLIGMGYPPGPLFKEILFAVECPARRGDPKQGRCGGAYSLQLGAANRYGRSIAVMNLLRYPVIG